MSETDVRVTPQDGINPATVPTADPTPDHPHDVRVMPPAPEPVPVGPAPEDVAVTETHDADVRVTRAPAATEDIPRSDEVPGESVQDGITDPPPAPALD